MGMKNLDNELWLQMKDGCKFFAIPPIIKWTLKSGLVLGLVWKDCGRSDAM